MADTIVRLLDASEVETFRRIRLESLRLAPSAFGSRVEEWEALSDAEWRQRLVGRLAFVAFSDGAPAGIMGLIRERGAKTAHRAPVANVYIRENLRGRGVSTRLLETLTDHARRLGIRQLELVVNVENEVAVSFYRRNGFVEFGRIPGGLCIDGREIDEILMARRLDK